MARLIAMFEELYAPGTFRTTCIKVEWELYWYWSLVAHCKGKRSLGLVWESKHSSLEPFCIVFKFVLAMKKKAEKFFHFELNNNK